MVRLRPFSNEGFSPELNVDFYTLALLLLIISTPTGALNFSAEGTLGAGQPSALHSIFRKGADSRLFFASGYACRAGCEASCTCDRDGAWPSWSTLRHLGFCCRGRV